MTSTQRSKMMSAVKSKDTKPEIAVRKILYSTGYRYRLHAKGILGKRGYCYKKAESGNLH